jgi:hypothetical protein
MKQLRIFSLISCFVISLFFLIFSFSNISIAEQTSVKDCINSCASKKQVCFNINADKRMCEVEFQNCAAACKPEGDSSTSTPAQTPTPIPTQQGSNSTGHLR